jgi:hypothetical protein
VSVADGLRGSGCQVTYEYYWGRLMVDWPGAPNNLRSHTAATKFKVRCDPPLAQSGPTKAGAKGRQRPALTVDEGAGCMLVYDVVPVCHRKGGPCGGSGRVGWAVVVDGDWRWGWQEVWRHNNEVVRRSTVSTAGSNSLSALLQPCTPLIACSCSVGVMSWQAKLWLDRGLTPVRAYVNAIVPEVQVRGAAL